MINRYYYKQMPSKNILNEDQSKNLTNSLGINYSDNTLNNMIINSNLENGNEIK